MRATKIDGIEGPLVLEPRVFGDSRGILLESYRRSVYREVGILCDFDQDNHSTSKKDTIRGMHFQRGPGQAKLIRVAAGRIYDVAVDIRPSSPSFGRWCGVELDAESHKQFFLPPGFAHGFCVLSDTADVLYKLSTEYDPSVETGFHLADAEVGIEWPVELQSAVTSTRDQEALGFRAALAAAQGD